MITANSTVSDQNDNRDIDLRNWRYINYVIITIVMLLTCRLSRISFAIGR